MKGAISLIFRSLQLDFAFSLMSLPLFAKVSFIFKKYLLLLEIFRSGYQSGKTSVTIFGRDYFVGDKFGLAFLQSVYVDNGLLKKYIPPDGVVVDVGANVGQFNFFCKHFLRAKRVYSFEPIQESFEVLKKNCPELIYRFAISTQKIVTMYIPETNLMASSLRPMESDRGVCQETVRGITLAEIPELTMEKNVDLIKFDTEGSELDAIRASANLLIKAKYILIEASLQRTRSGTLSELLSYLQELLPNVTLAEVGRTYRDKDKIEAVDLLFYNQK